MLLIRNIIIKSKYGERKLKRYLLEKLNQWIVIVSLNKMFQELIREYKMIGFKKMTHPKIKDKEKEICMLEIIVNFIFTSFKVISNF